MINQYAFIDKVQKYLQKQFGLSLDLPNLTHVDASVELRYSNQDIFSINNQNRYAMLIGIAEQLLKKNVVNSQYVMQYGQKFFNIITQDISVITANQQLRAQSLTIKDKISSKTQEIQINIQHILKECVEINDKEDVIYFLQTSLKTLFKRLRQFRDNYEAIKSIQVWTSVNIDSLYKEELSNEEDYLQHYQPLLDVMQRLKSNMIKLYQDISRCDPYQVPLKNVNFLANSRNLLCELQPFLISNSCAFNRLIFHVVDTQKANLFQISKFYNERLDLTFNAICDIFKCVFIGYMFEGNYRLISRDLEICKESILNSFEQYFQSQPSQYNKNRLLAIFKKQEDKLQDSREQIKSLKRLLSCGKDSIMKHYIRRKQCKKMSLLMKQKDNYFNLLKLLQKSKHYLQMDNEHRNYSKRLVQLQQRIPINIENIQKPMNFNNYLENQGKLEEFQKKRDIQLKKHFLEIQAETLILNQFMRKIQGYYYIEEQSILKEKLLGLIINKVNELNLRYVNLEVIVLNALERFRRQKKQKQQEASKEKAQIIAAVTNYIEQGIGEAIGYDIVNEDTYCEDVKVALQKLDNTQYLVKTYLEQQNFNQVLSLRFNLQWLLLIFQGSMDDRTLQSMIDKLDFEVQDWRQNFSKVQMLLKDIKTYIKDLKDALKSKDSNKMLGKIGKIIRERIQLYEIIQDIFSQSILIFSETKKMENLNIETKGAKLFDEKVYNYILAMYQYKNKLRVENVELQELLIPQRTKNYLSDQIFQPFQQKFNHHISYTQQDLLNFMLRFEHALTLDRNLPYLLTVLQQAANQPPNDEYFNNLQKVCTDLEHIEDQNKLVQGLSDDNLVIHNIFQFKEKSKMITKHCRLARDIKNEVSQGNLILNTDYQDPKLNLIKSRVITVWKSLHKIPQSSRRSQVSQVSSRNSKVPSQKSRKIEQNQNFQ